ncbi:MAG: hypothetical protein Tsb0020_32700 [Haliangiales bacterium]
MPGARRAIAREDRRGERGLTLIELMVSVVVASILIGFVFDIQTRMSGAFRSQTTIGSMQQGLRAAAEMITYDARSAGYKMPTGALLSTNFPLPETTPGLVYQPTALPAPVPTDVFGVPTADVRYIRPVRVFNNPSGRPNTVMQPDQAHFFYGINENTHAVITAITTPLTSITVDDPDRITVGDRVIIVNEQTPVTHPLGSQPGLPEIVPQHACILEVTGPLLPSNQLEFSATTPFNTGNNEHCTGIAVDQARVYKLISHAYRIDTTRANAALLQRSTSGGLLDDWEDIGIGFVDLQFSERHVQATDDGFGDLDGDGIARMDWYSAGNSPDDPTVAGNPLTELTLTQLGVSMVARTQRRISGVATAAVPVLSGPIANHNPVGDSGGPKDTTAPEYAGENVYRQTTLVVDTRNIGVAQ